MDKSNLFDQKIRDAVNKYEVPFDDSLWKNIEKEINVPANTTPAFNLKPWIIGASIAASIAIAYFAFKPAEEQSAPEIIKTEVKKEAQVEEQTTMNTEDESIIPIPVLEEENESVVLIDQQSEINEVQETSSLDPITPENDELKLIASDDEDNTLNEDVKKLDDHFITENTSPIEEQLIVDTRLNKEVCCLNDLLTVSISKSNMPIEVLWDFGDGFIADGPTASHQYQEPGEYTIKMHAKSLLNDDLVRDEKYKVQVNPIPTADFEITKNENMFALPKVEYKVVGDEMDSFKWKFDDNSITDEAVVEKLYNRKGVYTVGLIVSNQYHCTDTLFKQVMIEEDFNLLAPNAFSPNGDGINDTFIPQALPYLNQTFTLQIFDPKTSQLVFETDNYDIPWNGMLMNNGAKVNEGAYAWSVKTEDGSIYKGTILITAK
jgi:gliding motility-associated-like protein